MRGRVRGWTGKTIGGLLGSHPGRRGSPAARRGRPRCSGGAGSAGRSRPPPARDPGARWRPWPAPWPPAGCRSSRCPRSETRASSTPSFGGWRWPRVGDEEQVADGVGEHPVDLLGHVRSKLRRPASTWIMIGRKRSSPRGEGSLSRTWRHQRAGDGGVHVADHQHRLGLLLLEHRLEALHHLRGLHRRGRLSPPPGRVRPRDAPDRRRRPWTGRRRSAGRCESAWARMRGGPSAPSSGGRFWGSWVVLQRRTRFEWDQTWARS